MEQTSINSLRIPMQERSWLVPGNVLAEVIPLRHPDRPGHGQEWLLGWINWRDQNIPLLSFERLNQSGRVVIGPAARIAVFHTITGTVPFYAMIIQDQPQPVAVDAATLRVDGDATGPIEAFIAHLEDDVVLIPDLDKLEHAVSGLQFR